MIVAFKGKLLFEREIFGKSLRESLQFRYALEIRFQEYIFCFVEKFFPSCGEKKKKKKKTGRFENGGKERKGSGKSCKKEDGRDNMAAFPCIWSELGGRDSASNLINKLKKKKKKTLSYSFRTHTWPRSFAPTFFYFYTKGEGEEHARSEIVPFLPSSHSTCIAYSIITISKLSLRLPSSSLACRCTRSSIVENCTFLRRKNRALSTDRPYFPFLQPLNQRHGSPIFSLSLFSMIAARVSRYTIFLQVPRTYISRNYFQVFLSNNLFIIEAWQFARD